MTTPAIETTGAEMLTPSGIGTTPSLGTIGGLGSESEAQRSEGSSESNE